MKTRPEGGTSTVQGPWCAAPTGTNNKGPGLSNFRGTAQSAPDPEALDTLMDKLQYEPVSEEHHTLMGMVVEMVLSAKRGLNEAFTGPLRGFKVRIVIFLIVL